MLMHIPLFVSSAEIAFIVFILVMVFGADKIPEIVRGLGKGMRTIRNATEDIKQEISKSATDHGIDGNVTKDIQSGIDEVKNDLKDFTGSIRRK